MKYFKFLTSTLGSILLIILGIIFIVEANMALPFIGRLIIIFNFIFAFIRFTYLFIKNDRFFEHLLYIIIYLAIAISIVYLPLSYTRFIGYVTGVYALINTIISFIDYRIRRKNHLNGIVSSLFKIIIYFIFSVAMILMPIRLNSLIFIISGSYLIILGSFNFLSTIKDKFKIQIALPVIISAILPSRIFFKMRENKENEKYLTKDYTSDEISDLEIFIYVGESGFESFGHIDIAFKGIIYSYGLHDPKKRSLMGSMGDGVLVKAKRDPFVKNCLKSGKTIIFNFKLKPNNQDMQMIENRLIELEELLIPFDCDAKIQENNHEIITANDYISDVYIDTKCELYKFKSGSFKTYFVFTANCVALSDYLIRNKELDLLKMNGIISPGTYLNFLFRLYNKPDSIIKDLKIYKRNGL